MVCYIRQELWRRRDSDNGALRSSRAVVAFAVALEPGGSGSCKHVASYLQAQYYLTEESNLPKHSCADYINQLHCSSNEADIAYVAISHAAVPLVNVYTDAHEHTDTMLALTAKTTLIRYSSLMHSRTNGNANTHRQLPALTANTYSTIVPHSKDTRAPQQTARCLEPWKPREHVRWSYWCQLISSLELACRVLHYTTLHCTTAAHTRCLVTTAMLIHYEFLAYELQRLHYDNQSCHYMRRAVHVTGICSMQMRPHDAVCYGFTTVYLPRVVILPSGECPMKPVTTATLLSSKLRITSLILLYDSSSISALPNSPVVLRPASERAVYSAVQAQCSSL
eukprot:7909-Heterococcus_DN1.PRE.1